MPISFILLIMIIILFTEPNKDDKGNMRTQILNISNLMDDNEEEENMSQKKEEKILKQNQ